LLLKTRPFLSFQISQEKRRAREAKSLRLDINAHHEWRVVVGQGRRLSCCKPSQSL
jgi:hypothetical protein